VGKKIPRGITNPFGECKHREKEEGDVEGGALAKRREKVGGRKAPWYWMQGRISGEGGEIASGD